MRFGETWVKSRTPLKSASVAALAQTISRESAKVNRLKTLYSLPLRCGTSRAAHTYFFLVSCFDRVSRLVRTAKSVLPVWLAAKIETGDHICEAMCECLHQNIRR